MKLHKTNIQRTHCSNKFPPKYYPYHHDALGMLTNKHEETLEKINACYDELTEINEREIFAYTFRLGPTTTQEPTT